MSNLNSQIKAKAHNLGFSFCGITSMQRTPHANVFTTWAQSGYAGEMQYLEKPYIQNARKNPQSLLPDGRSAILLGIHYEPEPGKENLSEGLNGQIASYALYEDYHDILHPKIKDLIDWLKELTSPKAKFLVFVDSGPVMEKDFALQAGLGMIGKNSLLFHPNYGSYVFLGCVFTNITLQTDQPMQKDLCGSCVACIKACPTRCILNNRTLDARRCIAYLTIEYKGIIPITLRSKIGNRIFGCDICQDVCPENQRILSQKGEAPPLNKLIQGPLNLLDEVQCTQEEFDLKYNISPINRLTYEMYLRNVVVAMGNLQRSEFVSPLRNILMKHPATLLRAHAAWALGNYGIPRTRRILHQAVKKEKSWIVLSELQTALSTSK